MKVVLAPGWKTEVDRGPNWLFVKLYGPDGADADAAGLAETLAAMMQQEFARRLVLELDEVRELPHDLVRELVQLHGALDRGGRVMRLSGVSDANQQLLRENRVDQWFPQYRDREHAVMGSFRPTQPR